MSKQNEIKVNSNRRIEKITHAMIPLHLYEILFRTACECAMNGDRQAAQWVIDELIVLGREEQKRAYLSAKANSGLRDIYYGKPCVNCGRPADTIDHIVPLCHGGTNEPDNLQPMCRDCNSAKSDKV